MRYFGIQQIGVGVYVLRFYIISHLKDFEACPVKTKPALVERVKYTGSYNSKQKSSRLPRQIFI